MPKVIVITVLMFVSLIGCKTTQTAAKSDEDFKKALEESEKNKNKKLDFLANEKLPNEEYVVKDTTTKAVQAEEESKLHPIDYAEVPPQKPAKFRVQVFAGSVVNAQKNYAKLSSEKPNEVYMINDKEKGLWKVWVGNYATHDEAEKAKDQFIKAGYPDSWVHEMKGDYAPMENLFWVQAGALQNENAAQKLKSELESKQKEKVQIEKGEKIWKVWVGGYADKKQADELKKKLQGLGYAKAFIVKPGEK
jgi:cell division septation protein DedD